MYPILWQVGDLIIPTWHVLFVIASISGFLYLRLLTKRFHQELLLEMPSAFLWAYMGALIGARLFSVFIENNTFDLQNYLNFDSLTFYGGFLGGVLFVSIWIFCKKLHWSQFWDLMIPPLFLGLAIGRIGCFLNGDDYGIPAPKSLYGQFPWWSVTFPNHPEPIPRYPVQLMESAGALVLAISLPFIFRKLSNTRTGLVGSLGILSYCILRFCLEFYRDDFRGWVRFEELSSAQFTSLVIALTVIVFYILKQREVSIENLYKNWR